MAITVFQKGETTFSSGNGYKTPTNPLIESNTSFGSTDRLFTLIYPDDSTSSETFVEVGTSSENTERNNLQTTKGFRIKCFDSITSTGVQLTGGDYDSTFHYFVLIHSDDHLKHHFARVTDIITEDVVGDAFEFTPALGKEIPKDTKFMLFKGPALTTTAIAFSAGIKQDLKASLVVSSPLFHLLESSLNKKNELDHNTKYFVRLNKTDSGGTTTLDTNSEEYTFVTEQEFSNKILDYSKYSMQLTLVDKLKDLDNPSTHTSNEGNTINSLDYTDYDDAFPNARRDNDDLINPTSQIVNEGPIRYLHYDFSPTKVNVLDNVIDNKLEQSIGNRGGFCETKIMNPSRMLTSKITEFDKYRVRHRVFTGDLNEFVDMKITLGSLITTFSDARYNLITDYSDATNFINVGDEIRIGNRILICAIITSSVIKFEEYSRLETESSFTNSTSLTSLTGTLQRRAYNYQDNTILTSFNLLAGRSSELYVKTMSKDMEFIESSVTAVDATHGLITLSSNSQSYSSDSSLRYSLGSYHIEVERFSGTIEKVDSYKEDSQNYVELSGRSDISKLFGPIINKDTAFSEDIIYSTLSPYNTLSEIRAVNYTIALGGTSLNTGVIASSLTVIPLVGDRLFTVNGYIGEVLTAVPDGSAHWNLTFTPSLTKVHSERVYVETDKNYIFNKALSSSHLASVNPTSLSGSAGKGVFFTSGKEITMSDGSEGNDLVGSSINTNPKAIGYHINDPISIKNDNAFQAKFVDEIGSESDSSFDTVNTLIDFEVVNTNSKEGITEIELAPYVPITLGRKIPKFLNTDENSSVTAIGELIARETFSSTAKAFALNLLVTNTTSTAWTNAKVGEPVFRLDSENYIFMGILRFISFTKTSSQNSVVFHLDRDVTYSAGITIYHLNADMQELSFINGKHLATGKIITLPHPKITSTGSVPLNHQNPHNTNEDIFKKFGQPMYRLNSVALGNFNYFNAVAGLPITSSIAIHQLNTYAKNVSKINYLSEVYQFKPKTGSSNVTIRGKTNSSDKHWYYDERGKVGVFGSNFTDTIFHTNSVKTRALPFYGLSPLSDFNAHIFRKNALENTDNSFLRLFLYINSDILPYSSLRKDSLFNGSKDITNYNVLLLQDKSIEDNALGDETGNRIKLQDTNYSTNVITSSDFSNSIKRCGMMRLTEMCFDYAFNPFNPEKEIDIEQNVNSSTNLFTFYRTFAYTDIGTINVSSTLSQHGAGNTRVIVFNSAVSFSSSTLLVDARGNFIGTAPSASSSNNHTLASDVFYTGEDAALTTDNIFAVTQTGSHIPQIIVRGENLYGTRSSNLVKKHAGAVIPSLSQYGKTQGTAFSQNSNADISLPSDSEIFLPIRDGTAISSFSADTHPFRVFSGLISNIASDYYKGTIAVCLDRYDIEDGGKFKLEAGNVSDVLTTNDSTESFHIIKSNLHFKDFSNAIDTSANTHSDSIPFVADGIVLGFKCRLWVSSSSRTANTTLNSSNGTIRKNTMDATNANAFLEFVDLTGCYLIMEKDAVEGDTGTQTTVAYLNESIPEEIIYVISHEIDVSNHTNHVLITDKELTNDRAYRLMQPNEVCMYNFTPEDIVFNKLSSRYTKKANSNETYKNNSSYLYQQNIKDHRENEGILSMYVAVDIDKQTTDDYIVIRDIDKIYTELFPQENTYSLYASDGEHNKKISISVNRKQDTDKKYYSTFSETFFCKGIVSLSETFTVQSRGTLEIVPNRAYIGTTATIANETEELINELMEENNITFDLETQDYPLYLAPNYQGVDLFSAINFLLEQKDLTLFEENGTFKIKDRLANDFFKGIVLNETGEYQIFDFEESKNMFNFYNQITVYGRNHKKIRKDISSINKVGLKAFEVFNAELTTQEDVNKEASALLKLHSSSNKKLKITVGHSKISQIKVGDIINVEIPRENIPLSQFMVLQIEYLLTGLMVLELGKYSKGLEDRFADLIIQNKKINSQLRNESFKESESLDFLEEVKINQIRLFARKRTSSGTFKLGFGTTLNTGTNTLGHGVGTGITFTTLIDEELI